MKKVLYSIFVIFLFMLILGTTNSSAAILPYEEALELIEMIPDKINLDVKESTSDFEVIQLINKEVEKVWGRNDVFYDISHKLSFYDQDIAYIKKFEISIQSRDSNLDYKYVKKDITVNYVNSEEWNQEDYEYVKANIANASFLKIWEVRLYEDGKTEYPKDMSWELKKYLNVDDIAVIGVSAGEGGSHDVLGFWYDIYYLSFYKNDVLYARGIESSVRCIPRIVIPDNVEENDDSYIKYAKPIIEKYLYYENEYEGDIYKYEYTIKDLNRKYDDSIQFEFKVAECKEYKNGILEKKSIIDYTEYDSVLPMINIAKENEYRHKIIPTLKNVEITEENNKTFINGQMHIVETEIGYKKSLESKPEIIFIDDNNKEYNTVVTKEENDIYYFEIEKDSLKLGQNYRVQVRNASLNNKYPENNVNAVLERNISIDIINDNIEIKSLITEEYVQLYIDGEKSVLGDISGDGKINTKDARIVLLSYVGKEELTETQKIAADVNKDGKINTKDARQILLYYVGKINEF